MFGDLVARSLRCCARFVGQACFASFPQDALPAAPEPGKLRFGSRSQVRVVRPVRVKARNKTGRGAMRLHVVTAAMLLGIGGVIAGGNARRKKKS